MWLDELAVVLPGTTFYSGSDVLQWGNPDDMLIASVDGWNFNKKE